jgi:hypothetical protein
VRDIKVTVHVGALDGLAAARDAAIAQTEDTDAIEIIVSQPVGGAAVERQAERPAQAPAKR